MSQQMDISTKAEAETETETEPSSSIKSSVHQCECGKVFLAESSLNIHKSGCGREDPEYYTLPRKDNEDYQRLLRWLTHETEHGPVTFKSVDICGDLGMKPSQVGTFMKAVEIRNGGFDVARLAYTRSTKWEVSQA